jgi:penicillin-binding protein 2
VVVPDQLPAEFRKGLLESYPGSGDATVPIDPENWITVTDGMAEVTQPGYFHTAGSAHLEGIDFGGKTGTAQLMSHEALEKTNKGRATFPNVWFVGVTPRRNPELVVAVLWQNGEFSYYPARIGAKVVSAYVEKQRRLAHNLVPVKTAAPVVMGAVWTAPGDGKQGEGGTRMQGGAFLVKDGRIVAQASARAANPQAASLGRGQ